MLFFTMLQQAGCYGKGPTDPDLAKSARKWAISAYKENNVTKKTAKTKSKNVRQRRQTSPAPAQAEIDDPIENWVINNTATIPTVAPSPITHGI